MCVGSFVFGGALDFDDALFFDLISVVNGVDTIRGRPQVVEGVSEEGCFRDVDVSKGLVLFQKEGECDVFVGFPVLHVPFCFVGEGWSWTVVPDLVPVGFVFFFGIDKVKICVFGPGEPAFALFEPGGGALFYTVLKFEKPWVLAHGVTIFVVGYVVHFPHGGEGYRVSS